MVFVKSKKRWLITINTRAIVVLMLLIWQFGCSCNQTLALEKENKTVNELIVYTDKGKETISRHIYGHFAEHLGRCFYDGIWVGEDSSIPNTRGIRKDIVEALKKIKIPVLRWPGGCFADEYHWMDGIGPKDKRPSMVNTHWGMVTEDNSFGTHEFLDLCEQLGCEPYICGNVGSGTVQEMQQWVEYVTSDDVSPMTNLRRQNGQEKPWKVKYWGVGNESWGCGGHMRPEYYADLYRRYGTYLRNFGDNKVYRIACGPNSEDYNWTEVLMQRLKARRKAMMDGLSLHYYCWSGEKSRSATQYDEHDWFVLLKKALRMDEIVTKHSAIMDRYDPTKYVALIVDEWGAWHEVEPGTNPRFLYQQNTLRDAMVAALTFNIFNQHCDRVRMTNIAQTVNVLQAMILTKDEQMILTPTYHVFEMYAVHHDATLLPTELKCDDYNWQSDSIPALNVSASRGKSGAINISICNIEPGNPKEILCRLEGAKVNDVSARILTAETITAHNTFENPNAVKPTNFSDFSLKDGDLLVKMPPKSIVVLEISQ